MQRAASPFPPRQRSVPSIGCPGLKEREERKEKKKASASTSPLVNYEPGSHPIQSSPAVIFQAADVPRACVRAQLLLRVPYRFRIMQNSAERIVCCESRTSVRPGYLSFRSKDIYPGLIAVTLGHTGTLFCSSATSARREMDRR